MKSFVYAQSIDASALGHYVRKCALAWTFVGMTKRYLRFADLKRMGVVGNWQTLKRWIEKEGFPPGIKVGNTRLWLESEIEAWLASHSIAAQQC